MDPRLQKLQDVLTLVDRDQPTTEEVAEAIDAVINVVAALKDNLSKDIGKIDAALAEKYSDMSARLSSIDADLKKRLTEQKEVSDTECKEIKKLLKSEVERLEKIMPDKTDLSEVLNMIEKAEKKIPRELTSEKVRDKLEALEGDERLDKSAIKGLEEALKNARTNGGVTLFGGARGVDVYVDGVNKGTAQYLNFIAGTGVDLTFNMVGARNDITISATGGGGGSLSVLDVSGDIDDSNLEFTVDSEPTLVIINGASYRATGGNITWTYEDTTLTLSSPIGSGGSIYALG